MASLVAVALLLLFKHVPKTRASPTALPALSTADCVDYKVPLTITSENLVYNASKFKTNYDVANFVAEFIRKDSSDVYHPFSGKVNQTVDCFVSATFCTPKSTVGKEKTVILATHGVGYDGRYWNSQYKPSEYNFVDAMINKGYSVFFYDRLGTGKSQKVSGYTNQASNQVEIIAALAKLVRQGKYTSKIGAPSSIVLVGHSFGSYTSNSVLAKYPDVVDAAVLTGIAYAPSPPSTGQTIAAAFAPRIASTMSRKYKDFDTGYLSFADEYTHYSTFFKAPYEVEAAEYATSITHAFALTEYLSTTSLSLASPKFGGPVLVTTGEYDLPACAGECKSSFVTQTLKDVFPKSRLIKSFLHPGAGHGINFAKNASGFYENIASFLQEAGF